MNRVTEQIKGATLIPKLALNVMSCEVLRLMVLTKSSIMPLSYQVPRKVCFYDKNVEWMI